MKRLYKRRRYHSAAARRRLVRRARPYRTAATIRRVMDDWHLDPVLGLLPGGIGDTLSGLATVPYLYVSAVMLRSPALTLAIVYNTLRDVLIGLIPFWIGDVLDFFCRSYRRNYALLTGYVEGDRDVVADVERRATITAVMIALLIVAIVAMVMLLVWLARWLTPAWSAHQ